MVSTFLKYPFFLACLLTVTSTPANSQDMGTLFSEGNRLYQNGMYVEALEKYNEILDRGLESGELYYNIGNVHYKLQNPGFAVLNYERARRFMPEDDDLLNNFDLVAISLADRITPLPEIFYVRFWNTFRTLMGNSAWKALFASAWIFSILNLILLLFIRQNQVKKILKTGAVCGVLVITVAAAALITNSVTDKPGLDAVIMAQEVNVFSSPSEAGTEIFLIHEGTIVRIKRTQSDWIEISLLDGKVGWIQENSVEII